MTSQGYRAQLAIDKVGRNDLAGSVVVPGVFITAALAFAAGLAKPAGKETGRVQPGLDFTFDVVK